MLKKYFLVRRFLGLNATLILVTLSLQVGHTDEGHLDPFVTFNQQHPSYFIEIYKGARRLLLRKHDRVVRSYVAAVGSGGDGDKRVSGDKRTPIGKYHIVDIRSSKQFHIFLQLDYPNQEDALRAFNAQTIQFSDMIAISRAYQVGIGPPASTKLGGSIGIHGIGIESVLKRKLHDTENWTRGCIAITNAEIRELRRFVKNGTPVYIYD